MQVGNDLAIWLASVLLLGFRVTPVFVFAPPFTLTRVPRLVLWLFSYSIAIMLVAANPDTARITDLRMSTLAMGAARELFLGLIPLVALQLMFGALYLVGRTIDIQSGFGLAVLVDPATRGQLPLAGTLFAYLAGVIFFAINGHHELLRFFSASLDVVPLGYATRTDAMPMLLAYVSIIFLMAFGVGGAAIITLFLSDMVIAMLARTVPQLNALLLGIQVKAILFFVAMPIAISVGGAIILRMTATALRSMARLV